MFRLFSSYLEGKSKEKKNKIKNIEKNEFLTRIVQKVQNLVISEF